MMNLRSNVLCLVAVIWAPSAFCDEPSADRGYHWLRTKTYLPPDFDQQVFDALWKTWPKELQDKARDASLVDRRKMTFEYYGLVLDGSRDKTAQQEDADDYLPRRALGYVDDGKGGWVMSCLACHGGKVAGRAIPGLPNSHFALQTLVEDVRMTKLFGGKKFAHLDRASLTMPLGTNVGTTNSVVFGVVLAALRDSDMIVDRTRKVPPLRHHDMDAPALWHVKKKTRLYADGFAPKNHRVLMQFMMLPRNDANTLKSWEPEFADILAWIESLTPPKYPWPINQSLASQGKTVFNQLCSRCHGTYGEHESYPEKLIPIDVIGTDRVRLDALNIEHRRWMKDGWMSRYGEDKVDLNPGGYVAPPLDGVWATAPYFHNGSVPTLWHVLHPKQRPTVWRRSSADGYDRERGGIEAKSMNELPSGLPTREQRHYFNTLLPGKSARGHVFPQKLSPQQRAAVLEYLKTL